MGNDVKGFTKVQVDTSAASLSSTKWVSLSWKGIRLVKQDLPFTNPSWLGLIPWFHVSHDSTQDDVFHDLPWHLGQADRLVDPGILHSAILVGRIQWH